MIREELEDFISACFVISWMNFLFALMCVGFITGEEIFRTINELNK